MKVYLIASTRLTGVGPGLMASYAQEPDVLAEFAGRTCYLSYDKPNPRTRENKDYLANILGQQHESVLEHASASFYVEGVSRNLLIELERHRFLSFSVVSTRYVDAHKLGFVMPITHGGDTRELSSVEMLAYDTVYRTNREDGKTQKQSREAAAHYLPGGLETRFVVSGNFRAWRDVIRKRDTDGANAEIRLFAQAVLANLKGLAPNSFQDLS